MTVSHEPAWLAELSEAWPDQQPPTNQQTTTMQQQPVMDFGSLVIRDQHSHGDGRTSPAVSSSSSDGSRSPAAGTFVMRTNDDRISGSMEVKQAAADGVLVKAGNHGPGHQLAWAVSAFGGLLGDEAPKTPNRLQALFMVPSPASPVAVTAPGTPLEASPSAVPLPVTPNPADSPTHTTPSHQHKQSGLTPVKSDTLWPLTPHLIGQDVCRVTPGPSPASFQSVQAAELSTIAEEPEPETDHNCEADAGGRVAMETAEPKADVSSDKPVRFTVSMDPAANPPNDKVPTSEFSFRIAKAKRDSWRSLLPQSTPPPVAASEVQRTSTPTIVAAETALKASEALRAASDLPEMTMAMTPQLPPVKHIDMSMFKFHHDAKTRQHLEALVREVDGLCSPPDAAPDQPSHDLDASWLAQLRYLRASEAAKLRHQSPAFSSPMRPFSVLPGGSDSFDENGHLVDSRSAKRVRLSMSDWRIEAASPRPQSILSPIRSARNTRPPFQSLPRKGFSASAAIRTSTTPLRPPLRSLAHSAQIGQSPRPNASIEHVSGNFRPVPGARTGSESYFPILQSDSAAAQAILNRVDEARALMCQIRQRQASQESQRTVTSSQTARKLPVASAHQHLNVPRAMHHQQIASYSSKASTQSSSCASSVPAASASTVATCLVAGMNDRSRPHASQDLLNEEQQTVYTSPFQQVAASSTPLASPLLSPAIVHMPNGQDDPFNDLSNLDASRNAKSFGTHARQSSQSRTSDLQILMAPLSDRTSTPPLPTNLPLSSPDLPEIQPASTEGTKPIADTPIVKPVRSALKRADSFCTPLSNARSVLDDKGRFGRSVSFHETRTLQKAPLLERSKTAPPTSGLRHVAYAFEDAASGQQQQAATTDSEEDSTNPLALSIHTSTIVSGARTLQKNSTDEEETSTANLINIRHRADRRSTRSSVANASISTLAWHRKPLPANATIMTECSFGISHDKLVQVLTDVAPLEPDWKNLRTIDLSDRGVDSLIRLKEFLPKLDGGLFAHNKLSFLTGIAATIRFLDVSHNRLNDVTAFAHMASLETLNISHNTEISELRQLSCLKHLRELSANSCSITDLAGVNELDGLTQLHLSGNKLVAIDLSSSCWHRLLDLDLSRNQIKELSGISRLLHCRILNLDHNLLQSIGSDEALPSLRIFKISHNKLTKLDLAPLRHIRTVFADSNSLAEITGTSTLLHLENLSIRDQRQKHTSIDWHSLRDLRRLYFSNNSLPSRFPPESFLNLSLLEIAGCRLTSLPADFGHKFPNCRVLTLDNNFLHDLAPLVGMTRIKRLTLQGGRIDQLKPVLAILHTMPELELLDLRNNPVSLGFYATPIQQALSGGSSHQDRHFRASLPDEWLAKRSVYRSLLLSALPQLLVLDGLKISHKHRTRARTLLDTFANALV